MRFPPRGDKGCAENRRRIGRWSEGTSLGRSGRLQVLMGGDEEEPVMAKTKGTMVTGRVGWRCRGPEVD